MAFTDLIMKDVAAPLSGFDKAVATGFELAQNQEKIGLAQRQNQLEQEKIQMSYLDKANNLLPNLLKTTGKARSLLTNSYMNLMAKGGMPVNKDTMDLLAADESVASDYAAIEDEIRKQYPNDPVRQAAARAQYLGLPPGDAMTQVTGVAKSQLAIQAQSMRAASQDQRIRELQKMSQQQKVLGDIGKELDKRGGDTQKEVDTLVKNVAMVEDAINRNSLAAFDKTLGQQAKTAGTVGALSDYETRLQAPAGLSVKFAQAKKFLTGDAPIPDYVKTQIKEQITTQKNTAADLVVSRNLGVITDRISDPRSGPAYQIGSDSSGNLKIGFGAARILNSTNRALKSLKLGAQTLDLDSFVKRQSVPMSSEQILNLIRDASSGNLKDKKTNKPTGVRYIIKFSPNSIVQVEAPQMLTGPGSFYEDSSQDQMTEEGGE